MVKTRYQSNHISPAAVTFTTSSRRSTPRRHPSESAQVIVPEEEEESVTPIRNPRRLNPARTNTKGLPLNLQKQLLQDIEASGGIGDGHGTPFKLLSICNRRSELYGEAGKGGLRRKVQNKVQAWRNLNAVEYYKLLAYLGVQPGLEQSLPLSAPEPHASYPTPSPTPTPTPSTPVLSHRPVYLASMPLKSELDCLNGELKCALV
jgi:hypothetical protein